MRFATTTIVFTALLAGCGGHASTTKNNSKSTSSTSKDEGKVYTSDSKGGGGSSSGTESGGGASNATLPSPADTTDYKPSAPSDSGTTDATKGQPVMNPDAPAAHTPRKH